MAGPNACLKIYTSGKGDTHEDNEQLKMYTDMFRRGKKVHEWPQEQTDAPDTSSLIDGEEVDDGHDDDDDDSHEDDEDRSRTPSPPPEAAPTYDRAMSRSTTQPALYVAAETIVAPPAVDYGALLQIANDHIATFDARECALKARVEDLVTQLAASKAREGALVTQLEESQAQGVKLQADLSSANVEIRTKRAQRDGVIKERDDARGEIRRLQGELAEHQAENHTLAIDGAKARCDLIAAQTEIAALKARSDTTRATHQEAVADLQRRLGDADAQRLAMANDDANRQHRSAATLQELVKATQALSEDIKALCEEHAQDIDSLRVHHSKEIEVLNVQHAKAIETLRKRHQEILDTAVAEFVDDGVEVAVTALRAEHAAAIEVLNARHNAALIDAAALEAELRTKLEQQTQTVNARGNIIKRMATDLKHRQEPSNDVREEAWRASAEHRLAAACAAARGRAERALTKRIAELHLFAGVDGSVDGDVRGALAGLRATLDVHALKLDIAINELKAESYRCTTERNKAHALALQTEYRRRIEGLRTRDLRQQQINDILARDPALRNDPHYAKLWQTGATHRANFDMIGAAFGGRHTIARVAQDVGHRFNRHQLKQIGKLLRQRYGAHLSPVMHDQDMGDRGYIVQVHTYFEQDGYYIELAIGDYMNGHRPSTH